MRKNLASPRNATAEYIDGSLSTAKIERCKAYDEVLSLLRGLNADIVLLQEVDQGCRRTGYRNVARDLAAALDMNWVAVGEFQELG